MSGDSKTSGAQHAGSDSQSSNVNGADQTDLRQSERKGHDNDKMNLHPNSAPNSLEESISKLKEEVKEKEAKYLYLYAEFENFKKRVQKEKSDLVKFGWENVARDLLLVLDNLQRAVEFMPGGVDPQFALGIKMVFQQFQDSLGRNGVTRVSSKETPFDPHLHEAVAKEVSEFPEGRILREELGGYTLHGRLLRPARVVVSSGASPAS